jgi:hypothetical protein
MSKPVVGLLALVALEPAGRVLKLLLKLAALVVIFAVLMGSAVSGNSGWLVTPMLILLGVWLLALRARRG